MLRRAYGPEASSLCGEDEMAQYGAALRRAIVGGDCCIPMVADDKDAAIIATAVAADN